MANMIRWEIIHSANKCQLSTFDVKPCSSIWGHNCELDGKGLGAFGDYSLK